MQLTERRMDCAKLNRAASLPPKKRIKVGGNDIKPPPVFKRSLSLTLPARSPVLMLSRKLCQSQDSPNIRSWKLPDGLVEEDGENSQPRGTQVEVQCIAKGDISESKSMENEQEMTRDANLKERTFCVHESYHCCCGAVRKPADQMDESTQTENSPCKHIPIPPPPPPLPSHFAAPIKIVLKVQSTDSVLSTQDNEDSENIQSKAGEKELKGSTENAETTLEQNAVRYINDTDALEWASLFHEDLPLDLDSFSNDDSYEMRCVICYQCDITLIKCQLCDQSICSDCMHLHLKAKISEGFILIRCPADYCTRIISNNEIKEHCSELIHLYTKNKVDAENDPRHKTCPGCNLVHHFEEPDDIPLHHKCGSCGLQWCVKCHAPWHVGISCKKYQKDVVGKGHKALKVWAKGKGLSHANAKKCPSCKFFIERISGCDHMSCSRLVVSKFVFCRSQISFHIKLTTDNNNQRVLCDKFCIYCKSQVT